jgi:hypothetical protein
MQGLNLYLASTENIIITKLEWAIARREG